MALEVGAEGQGPMILPFAMALRTHTQQSDGAAQTRLDAFEKPSALAVDVPDYRKTPV
jgi:hypothetical protein